MICGAGPSNLFESLCGTVTELVNATTVVADTYYYPDANGLNMEGYSNLTFQFDLDAGAGGTATMTIEAKNDDAISTPQWDDITKAFTKMIDGTTATSYASTGASVKAFLERKDMNVQNVRVKIVVATASADLLKIHARRCAL